MPQHFELEPNSCENDATHETCTHCNDCPTCTSEQIDSLMDVQDVMSMFDAAHRLAGDDVVALRAMLEKSVTTHTLSSTSGFGLPINPLSHFLTQFVISAISNSSAANGIINGKLESPHATWHDAVVEHLSTHGNVDKYENELNDDRLCMIDHVTVEDLLVEFLEQKLNLPLLLSDYQHSYSDAIDLSADAFEHWYREARFICPLNTEHTVDEKGFCTTEGCLHARLAISAPTAPNMTIDDITPLYIENTRVAAFGQMKNEQGKILTFS